MSPRKMADVHVVVHFPRTYDGLRLLGGRVARYQELKEAKARGEHFGNLHWEIQTMTDEAALKALSRAVEKRMKVAKPKTRQRRR